MQPAELKESNLWWHGPPRLQIFKSEWQENALNPKVDSTLEIKKIKTHFTSSAVSEDILEIFLSLPRAFRI